MAIVFITADSGYKGHEALEEVRQAGGDGFLAKDTWGDVGLCGARDVEIIAAAVRRKLLVKQLDHLQYLLASHLHRLHS